MDISRNEIDETIKNILDVFTGSTVQDDLDDILNPDTPLSLTSAERREAYERGMREM